MRRDLKLGCLCWEHKNCQLAGRPLACGVPKVNLIVHKRRWLNLTEESKLQYKRVPKFCPLNR